MIRFCGLILSLLTLFAAGPVQAMINPALQPVDLFGRHRVVVGARIASVDAAAGKLTLSVTRVYRGSFAPRQVTVVATGAARKTLATGAASGGIAPGGSVVAFVGRTRRGREKDLLLYLGTLSGGTGPAFRAGTVDTPDRWTWSGDPGAETDGAGRAAATLSGAWNGAPDRFQELMADLADGRAFFPSRAYVRFKPDMEIDALSGAVRGVAIYDIDGDGDADLFAASPSGCRVYLQMEPLLFVDATEHMGISTARGVSVSFADADGDGRADLLLDGTLWRGEGERFVATDRVPTAEAKVVSAGFIDANGDGWPDLLVSRAGVGLRLYRNPGPAGGPFTDATEAAGLARPETGANLTGFWTSGDADGDGRADLFYGAGDGLLLMQGSDGRFSPAPLGRKLPLLAGPERQPALTGGGAFGPLRYPDRLDLVVPGESSWTLLTPAREATVDWTGYANEIGDGSFGHLATVAEDLNADGYVDLFTVSRSQSSFLHLNRGYGSFMNAAAHRSSDRLFDGPATGRDAWGVAAGDVDGDGVADLLIGDSAGRLTLLLNDTLSLRRSSAHPTADEKVLQDVRIVTARIAGRRGIIGARVTLLDQAGKVVALREIGGNNATGCRGPDTVDIAVRNAISGGYTLQVRFGDGHAQSWPVDLSLKPRVVVDARRTDGP